MAQDFPSLNPEEKPQEEVPAPQTPYTPAQPYPGPVQSFPSTTPPPAAKKNNRIWIIIGVVIVLLCCCCLLAAGTWLWNNGDSLMNDWNFEFESWIPLLNAVI